MFELSEQKPMDSVSGMAHNKTIVKRQASCEGNFSAETNPQN